MVKEGKVAAILNERELVVNLGAEADVREGMKFKVMEPGQQIIDPDTQEVLGEFSREKIRVEISDVKPKYSVGRTYQTYIANVSGALTAFAQALNEPRREVTRVRTLRTANTVSLEPMDETKSFVKIGDPVVLVEDSL